MPNKNISQTLELFQIVKPYQERWLLAAMKAHGALMERRFTLPLPLLVSIQQ